MHPIFSSHATDANVFFAISISIELVSVLLNLLLITQLVKQASRNLCHGLTFLVCTTDCVFSLCALVKDSLRAAAGNDTFHRSGWYCNYLETSCIILVCLSSMLVGMLALERYLFICRSTSVSPLLAFAVLSAGFIFLVTLGIGTGIIKGYAVDRIGVFCLPRNTRWSKSFEILVEGILMLSMATLILCYICIYRFLSSRDFPIVFNSDRALLPIIIYCFTFFPFGVYVALMNVMGKENVPKVFLMVALLILATVPIANSIIVFYFQPTIRKTLQGVFKTYCYLKLKK
ncbi:hypothetical protein DSO57_1007130 [Entomophthora muscae]|uniref:Uncharacterized protein n=1 Tax=Entomophthora muscae TaxID=34485 RepID=A0ACC2SKH5_9FUNG|nr:hypothetical protein DSO57_1007130 [Entomophthora muscae]